jgi:hypothetical protein
MDARPTHRTVGFTCTPELRRALVARARRDQVSLTRVIRDILERELLLPRETGPTGPLAGALDKREAAGVARFLTRSALPASEPAEDTP